MAGTGGASMVELENEGSRIESCDSENGNKRLKTGEDEEEDRFSALPDFLVHRILSLLPATDLVKTLFLSKWWKYQWTLVPVLEFVHIHGMSSNKFSNFIDKTLILHDCSNIDKFVIEFDPYSQDDDYPNLDSWILFSVRKNVKELVGEFIQNYLLPYFLFYSSSIVKLNLSHCYFIPTGTVNWGSLRSLSLHFSELGDEAIVNVLSGSPLLEYLELCCCQFYDGFVIASKRLKTLILDGGSDGSYEWDAIEISCPNLQRLRILGIVLLTSLKLINLPSSVYAALEFRFERDYMSHDDRINFVGQTLRQLEHVEELEIGGWLMEILSSSKEDGDCIGGLPDPFIQRIISFLPSTKEAFKTDHDNRWQRNWTGVPILIFLFNEKFVIYSKDIPLECLDPRLTLWIRFATKQDVKELTLDCDGAKVEPENKYPLPQFLFNNSSLVKMMICACDFMPNEKVNWECLKSLRLDYSELGNQAIEYVLSGSPLLECLELCCCGFPEAVVIASEHLKTCVLDDFDDCHLLEISCPNLESLKIWGNLRYTSLKLMNLPPALCASLHFFILEPDDISPDECMNLMEKIVKQIVHVVELDIELRMLRR